MIRRFLLATLATVAVPAAVLAQAPATEQQHEQRTAQSQTPPSGQNQQMMQMHEKMMAEMTAMDQKLDALVQQMNTAQGQAKVDAMGAVINEMVNQRKQMEQHMSSMMGMMGHGGMMGSMMGGQGQQGMMMGTSGGMMPGTMSTFDPVCRAKIANNTAPTATYQGKTYQFCTEADKQAFLKDPAKYVKAAR